MRRCVTTCHQLANRFVRTTTSTGAEHFHVQRHVPCIFLGHPHFQHRLFSSPPPAAWCSAIPPSGVYSDPHLYEAAFGFRDIAAEVECITQIFSSVHQAPVQSVIELGCGPALHCRELSRRGVLVTALDLSPDMIRHVSERAAEEKLQGLTVLQADMADFTVQKQVDIVICLLGTFSHLLTNSQAASCMRCVHSALKPGGLLLIELGHPGSLFDGSLLGEESGTAWEQPLDGGQGTVVVQWGEPDDEFDPGTQVLQRTVTVSLVDDAGEGWEVREVVPARQYTAQEVDLLATLTGFKVVQVLGALDKQIDLSHEDAHRMVFCLQKK